MPRAKLKRNDYQVTVLSEVNRELQNIYLFLFW